MKKVIITILTILILFILQTSVFHTLSFRGIIPNLILIAVCSYGYLRGESSGIIAGFFCGILIDIFFSEFLGLNSLILLFVGFFNGMINRFYVDDDIKLPVFCIALSDLLLSFVTYGLRFLLYGRFNVSFYFFNIILPEFLYTLVVSLFLFPIIKYIEYRIIPFSFAKDEDSVI